MLYAVTLHINVTDEAALANYVKAAIVPEFCQHPERITIGPVREALYWCYDPGNAFFPGTTIVNSSICQVLDGEPTYVKPIDVYATPVAAAGPAPAELVLPGFIPW